MEDLEKAARALHRFAVGETANWDGMRLPEQRYYLEQATTAFSAVFVEPSEELLEAAGTSIANFDIADRRTASSPGRWKDMGRAALAGVKKQILGAE